MAARCAAASPIPPNNALAFRMMRHGDDIGRHTVTFERIGQALTVRIAVDAAITLLSIPIVRYRHHAVEFWRGDLLIGITAQTDKNGEPEWMRAERTAEGLVVSGSGTDRYIAPPQARGISYWNRHMLDGPMISMTDGMLLHPKVTDRGMESIPLANGVMVAADHYNLSSRFRSDVWYDQSDTWASLAFSIADGSVVHYERL